MKTQLFQKYQVQFPPFIYSNILLFSFIFFLSGCVPTYQYVRNNNLTPIPTFTHENEVKVYFNESEIKDPFVRIKVLEVSNGNYQTLLNKLKKNGQLLGVDALIILGNTATEKVEGSDGYVSSSSIHTLYALGIKYIKNIDYLDQFVKKERLYLVENGKNELVGSVIRSPEGDVLEVKDSMKYFKTFILPFDLFYLQFDNKSNWYYQLSPFGLVSNRRILNKNGNILQEEKFEYGTYNLVKKVSIYKSLAAVGRVEVFYNRVNRNVDYKIIEMNKKKWKETFLYDNNEKLIGKRIDFLDDGKEIPFLAIEFEYYSNADLPHILDAD